MPQSPNLWWWLPGASVLAAGIAFAGFGVLDHDNAQLIAGGLALATGAAGFLIGKQSPAP